MLRFSTCHPRQRARTLAEGAVRQENLAVNSGSNEWPAPSPPVQQSRERLFRSFLRSINRSPRAEAQAQALGAIPTFSECSLVSFCTSDHESDSEEEIVY